MDAGKPAGNVKARTARDWSDWLIASVLIAEILAVLAVIRPFGGGTGQTAPETLSEQIPAAADFGPPAELARPLKRPRRDRGDATSVTERKGGKEVASAGAAELSPPERADKAATLRRNVETVVPAPRPALAAAPVVGTWAGTLRCPDAADIRIALRITPQGALGYIHTGTADNPLSPGCFTAAWEYDRERAYVEISPQGWLWRVGQTARLHLTGWLDRDVITGSASAMQHCKGFSLHRQMVAFDFPEDCRASP
jgi:hypothetical protein